MRERRAIRIIGWIGLILTFAAWVVSIAIQAPWSPWFTIGFWTIIGVGLALRLAASTGRKDKPIDAFHDVNDIYLGRSRTPYAERSVNETSQIAEAPPMPEKSIPDDLTNE